MVSKICRFWPFVSCFSSFDVVVPWRINVYSENNVVRVFVFSDYLHSDMVVKCQSLVMNSINLLSQQ